MPDLVGRPDERELVDQLARDLRHRLVLLAAQVEVLDLRDLLFVAHADRDVGVEVLALRAHAAEVERVVGAEAVGGGVDVVGDDERHCRRDLEGVLGMAGALAGEALVQRLPVHLLVRGREEHGEPAVAQLPAHGDVLRALGAEVDRDVLAQRVDRGLERLGQPRAVG